MGIIHFQGNPIQTSGELPVIGTVAPDFTVTRTDLGEIHLKNYLGKSIILNIFPSLDTTTCASAMLKFNEIAGKHPDILILCVSADLPFAQKRFCTAEHLENVQPVSVFRHPQFGKDYGVQIISGPLEGLLARAVIILDKQGTVIYRELVDDISEEPNYKEIIAAITKQTTSSI